MISVRTPDAARRARGGFYTLLIGIVLFSLSACGGSGDDDPDAPAGLSYAMTSAIYETGVAIAPNEPRVSGGAVDSFTIEPALPAGLGMDAATGVISGTPTAASAAAIYVVTAQNASGSATARLEIEVRERIAAPASLSYRDSAVAYTVGTPIPDNTPTSTGGPIAGYTVSPALPAGLDLHPETGVISGAPQAETPVATYTVTGTNAAGSIGTTLDISVQPALQAPASLSYDAAEPLYVSGEAIPANTPHVTGGAPTGYSVSPALPAGLSLNATTGVISGMPSALQAQAPYTITAYNDAGSAQSSVRITVTGRGAWTSISAALPTPVRDATAVALNDGRVLLAGGYGPTGPIGDATIYDPASDSFTAAAPMLVPRSGHTATLLADGRVLVTGGSPLPSSPATNHSELYDPVANTWTATGWLNEPRQSHTATRLPDGRVLAIGGTTNDGSIQAHATAEIYDPATGVWTLLPRQLSGPRAQHGAALLADGSAVLVTGGIDGSALLQSAELFPTDLVTPTTPMAVGGLAGNPTTQSVALANGKILSIADGSSTAWLYDPADSSWTTSTMNQVRRLATMTLLTDGRVLVAAGRDATAALLNSTEIYNPDVNAWTTAGSLTAGRHRAAAAPLPGGQAVVLGGSDAGSVMGSVERYVP